MRVLVTGGCGFIGTNLIKMLLKHPQISHVVNVDCMTYASNPHTLLLKCKTYTVDITDTQKILEIMRDEKIDHVMHLAAESHVDNSIKDGSKFIHTNVRGTLSMLDAFRLYVGHDTDKHKFLHVSTDEVFGSLKVGERPFYEGSPYNPLNPYSASKAASDHLVRAYNNTYELYTMITNCSNNFGKYQHREKFIPTVIRSFLSGESVPVYGTGANIRDWIYVEDHCNALIKVLLYGEKGETYCIGGNMEIANIDMVMKIYDIMIAQGRDVKPDIQYVMDRKGHDFRYALNYNKLKRYTGWEPRSNFIISLSDTINWYADIFAGK